MVTSLTDMLIHFNEVDDPEALLKSPAPERVVSAVTMPSTDAFIPSRVHWKAFGLHPMFADKNTEQELEILHRRCQRDEVDLIGEIGLDARDSMPAWETQEHVFLKQLELAHSFERPVILHLVKSHERALHLLRSFPTVRAFVHGFSGAPELAATFIRRGYYIGLGPAILKPKNKRAQRCAAELPLSSILLESDSPSAPPKGHAVTPAIVAEVALEISRSRGEDPDEVRAQLERNVDDFMGGPSRKASINASPKA